MIEKRHQRLPCMTMLRFTVARLKVVTILVMASLFSLHVATADSFPTRLTGIDSLVIYDAQKQPVRRITNLPPLAQCGADSKESLVLYPNGTSVLQFHDLSGRNTRNFALGSQVVRISRTDDGFLIVSDVGAVLEFSREGTPLRGLNSRDAVWAAKVGTDVIITVTRSGELRRYNWTMRTPSVVYGAEQAGRAVSFKAVAALGPSRFVAFDAEGRELVWFDEEMHEQLRTPFNVTDPTIFLFLPQLNSVLVSGAEHAGVSFISSDGSVSSVKTPLVPVCAGTVPEGGFVIGYSGKGSATLIEPPFDDLEGRMARLTYDCLFAIIIYAAVGAWCFAKIWIFFVAWLQRGRGNPECAPSNDVSESAEIRPCASAFGLGMSLLVAHSGLAGAWLVYPMLRGLPSRFLPELSVQQSWGMFSVCVLASGISLAWLGIKLLLSPRLQSLSPAAQGSAGMNTTYWFLALLSLVLAGVCNYRNIIELEPEYPNGSPKLIVACWIAAQVLIVMAFTRIPTTRLFSQWRQSEMWTVVGLCSLTSFSRLLWLDQYPHNIHHDFGVMGEHVLRYLLEPWFPIFTLDAGQSSGRPWYMQMAALMWLFGISDWTLRLSNIIWSVGFVLAAYLIGRETVSHRFGVIFGLLVAAQHNVLGYSRCPYVMESVAPFMFCLYFFGRGVRSMCARDFAVAGVWGAWSLMTIRNFTPYPFIGTVLVAFLVVVYPRTMWRLRWHLVLMVVAGAVVFGPYVHFYLYEQLLSARLFDSSPLLQGGRLSTDLHLWAHQLTRAFGGFIIYPDRISWEMETLVPVCAALTSGLFCAGLVILVSRIRSIGAAMALIVIAVDTLLGSALLEEPPSYYHVFVAIIFAMYVVAIPIEWLWQIALTVRYRIAKTVLVSCAVCIAGAAVVEEVWPFIRYSMPSQDSHGVPQPKYNAHSLMARYTLQHRERRFVAVSRPGNNYEFHNATIRLFYGAFSERFELFSDVYDYLPVRPGGITRDISFFIDNVEDLNRVRSIYPQGTLESFVYAYGESSIMVYTVPGAEVDHVWADDTTQPNARLLARFNLAPS
jgi:hypothetical protein